MGREVKRVPLDFDYPRGKVWFGYQIEFCKEEYSDGCERCREFARIMGIPMITYGDVEQPCPAFRKFYNVDPPRGEGFQLWGTTTEGEPLSPVFRTAEELAEWCEANATVFADFRATKTEWLRMIENNCFIIGTGNALFC